MDFIDYVYLFFAALSLYFMFLFLILYLSERKKLRKLPKIKKFPSVSIIIPAHNEEKIISKTIRNLKKLEYPRKIEIIVVDDGSTDRTAEIARREGVKVIRKKQGGKASALNEGIREAKGEIVVCIDADSFPSKDSLLKAVPFFSDPRVAAVTTSVYVKNTSKLIERMQAFEYATIVWSRKLLEFMDSVYVTPGAMSLYRRDVLLKVGGFDEQNMTEDIEIAWRLLANGYLIKMSLDSEVYTLVPNTFKKWWKQRIRWNIGGMQTTLKYFHTFLKKDFRSLGMFILPFFSFSYILSLLGFSVFLYVLFNSLYSFLFVTVGSYAYGTHPSFNFVDFFILPNVFFIFGTLIFVVSIIWMQISLKQTKKLVKSLRDVLELLLYLSFYITVFPINLIHSTIKFIRGKYEW